MAGDLILRLDENVGQIGADLGYDTPDLFHRLALPGQAEPD